jgi:hypothetical protein
VHFPVLLLLELGDLLGNGLVIILPILRALLPNVHAVSIAQLGALQDVRVHWGLWGRILIKDYRHGDSLGLEDGL